ncbi:hypothetical protein JX265_004826 [Neoarthrinium moseri]|uniref:Ap4A phosphorylase 1/2 N-terminal domain-containing protein n=1 Tax=Neoarthrinium moseri TaxID=1658444 RepID=A0A9P9WQ63_9PEZI|nr:hypothetical protein JX265_004826 [Neoarthrinium moseri]
MFCFARPRLMLLTSNPLARQYEPLHDIDVEAAWTLLNNFDNEYVAFFNCGQDAGRSRMCKHMQLMPLPKDTFAAFLDRDDGKEPNVPFYWFYRRLQPQVTTISIVIPAYEELCGTATLAPALAH